jgi:cytidylate kinase
MNILLCFSGQIGVGKSSVSAAVADELGWSRTGFGDYLRAEIARQGRAADDRKALQDLGQARVDEDAVAFCLDVLAAGGFNPGDNFVVDGIRHVRIFDILADVSKPSDAKLLFLGADDVTRGTRVQSRADANDLARASMHRVEAELRDALPDRADGVIDASQPMDRVVSACLELARSWRT